ncbi:MAG: glycosyltransferase family 4 protein [Treponema sp.]|nr:glycosyltransferase family 4 protein [Treponema sp.]
MLKLAVDCRMIGSGGIGSYISEIIPHLLHDATCMLIGTHEQCMDFVRMDNEEFCFCDIKPFSAKELFSFPRDVLEKINACDAYYTPYCNIPAGITVPVFSTIHDVVFFDVPDLTSAAGRFVRRQFYKRAINASKVIFTVSNFSKERILHHLHCKKPLVITYNGVPKYLTTPFDVRPQKADEILFVGNIKKHKGLSTLLDAWKKARSQGLTSRLVIVGNADNFRTKDQKTAALLDEAKNAGDGSLVFTGRISNEELKALYARAKLLVQPSLYEGFGIPPLEAMTVGTPVIISDIPVFKEIYQAYPVTWFEAGNAESLAEKLLKADGKSVDITTVSTAFSYKKSAAIILKTIEEAL